MPEYLAPGVYVEETSFRAKSIEGVGTSTTAFVGPTRKGPYRVDNDTPESPELLTSYGDFERIYGGFADLSLGDGVPGTNYLAHAVRAFFNEGGSRLYVSRVVGADPEVATVEIIGGADEGVRFIARFPGAAGNGQVVVREASTPASETTLANAPAGSLVRATLAGNPALLVRVANSWRPAANLAGDAVAQADVLAGAPHLITVSALTIDGDGNSLSFEDMGLANTHPRWIGHVMSATPSRRSDHLQNLYAVDVGSAVSPSELHAGLFNGAANNAAGQPERVWTLTGGEEGARGGPRSQSERPLRLRRLPRAHLAGRGAGREQRFHEGAAARGAGKQHGLGELFPPARLVRRVAKRRPEVARAGIGRKQRAIKAQPGRLGTLDDPHQRLVREPAHIPAATHRAMIAGKPQLRIVTRAARQLFEIGQVQPWRRFEGLAQQRLVVHQAIGQRL